MRYSRSFLLFSLIFFLWRQPATVAAPEDNLSIAGAVARPIQWSTADLQKQFTSDGKTIAYRLKGKRHKAHCIPLWSLLTAATPTPADPKPKNALLTFVVTVSAADGYAAAFSLSELSPNYGHAAVYVALDRDGQPLTDKDGPVELLVISDTKPSRWVHGMRQILVSDTRSESGGK